MAQKEAELRRDFRNAWEIPGEHFVVRTNVSLEAGVELSQKLELFYGWLQRRLLRRSLKLRRHCRIASKRRASVLEPQAWHPCPCTTLQRTEEYQQQVKERSRQILKPMDCIGNLIGRLTFFSTVPARIYRHCFTRQLIRFWTYIRLNPDALPRKQKSLKTGTRNTTPWVLCENSNFWIIEGLACYFESFEVTDGHISVGRPDYVRFDTARQRLLDPAFHFYLPAKQFFGLRAKISFRPIRKSARSTPRRPDSLIF